MNSLKFRIFEKLVLSLSLIAGFFVGRFTEGAPAQVLLIRHAEKLNDTNVNLSSRGQKRAQALVGFFKARATRFGTPSVIFAMDPRDLAGSLRAIQTVKPLANDLGITVRHDYKKKKIESLVHEILTNPTFNGRTVLICWEHKYIPKIVSEFGWHSAPARWRGQSYDRMWVLNLEGSRVKSFQDIAEHLLPGDSRD